MVVRRGYSVGKERKFCLKARPN